MRLYVHVAGMVDGNETLIEAGDLQNEWMQHAMVCEGELVEEICGSLLGLTMSHEYVTAL